MRTPSSERIHTGASLPRQHAEAAVGEDAVSRRNPTLGELVAKGPRKAPRQGICAICDCFYREAEPVYKVNHQRSAHAGCIELELSVHGASGLVRIVGSCLALRHEKARAAGGRDGDL